MIGAIIGFALIGIFLGMPFVAVLCGLHTSVGPRTRLPLAPRTNVDYWLAWARDGYLAGKTTAEEFEAATWDALHARPVNFDGSPCRDGDRFSPDDIEAATREAARI